MIQGRYKLESREALLGQTHPYKLLFLLTGHNPLTWMI
jgi:hypothetical protein